MVESETAGIWCRVALLTKHSLVGQQCCVSICHPLRHSLAVVKNEQCAHMHPIHNVDTCRGRGRPLLFCSLMFLMVPMMFVRSKGYIVQWRNNVCIASSAGHQTWQEISTIFSPSSGGCKVHNSALWEEWTPMWAVKGAWHWSGAPFVGPMGPLMAMFAIWWTTHVDYHITTNRTTHSI